MHGLGDELERVQGATAPGAPPCSAGALHLPPSFPHRLPMNFAPAGRPGGHAPQVPHIEGANPFDQEACGAGGVGAGRWPNGGGGRDPGSRRRAGPIVATALDPVAFSPTAVPWLWRLQTRSFNPRRNPTPVFDGRNSDVLLVVRLERVAVDGSCTHSMRGGRRVAAQVSPVPRPASRGAEPRAPSPLATCRSQDLTQEHQHHELG